MRYKLREQWRLVPVWIRKPLIFVTGWMFIITAGLIGWLPGPGGIPLFLIGIAILSTEFSWAKYMRELVMRIVRACSHWYREHRTQGHILIVLLALIAVTSLIVMIRFFFF